MAEVEQVVEQPTEEAQAPVEKVKKYRKPMQKKKVCAFCADRAEFIDYKDVARLRKFISERAKILPRRATGTCAAHQRELTTAIKRARQMALLPYVND